MILKLKPFISFHQFKICPDNRFFELCKVCCDIFKCICRSLIIDNPSVNVLQTLQDYADEQNRLNGSSSKIPDITLDGLKDPPMGAYGIGDRIRFSVPDRTSFAALNGQTWRLNEYTLTPDAEDGEEVQLKVGLS